MIGALRGWLGTVVTVTLLLSVAQVLIPEGSIRRIASFTGGLVLLLVLLQPVLETDLGRVRLKWPDYAEAVEERQSELEQAEKSELSAIIAEQTQAYISDKAKTLGLTLSAVVTTEEGEDGIPYPASVEIRAPRSEALADYLEQELGIPDERQVWYEQEGNE